MESKAGKKLKFCFLDAKSVGEPVLAVDHLQFDLAKNWTIFYFDQVRPLTIRIFGFCLPVLSIS